MLFCWQKLKVMRRKQQQIRLASKSNYSVFNEKRYKHSLRIFIDILLLLLYIPFELLDTLCVYFKRNPTKSGQNGHQPLIGAATATFGRNGKGIYRNLREGQLLRANYVENGFFDEGPGRWLPKCCQPQNRPQGTASPPYRRRNDGQQAGNPTELRPLRTQVSAPGNANNARQLKRRHSWPLTHQNQKPNVPITPPKPAVTPGRLKGPPIQTWNQNRPGRPNTPGGKAFYIFP